MASRIEKRISSIPVFLSLRTLLNCRTGRAAYVVARPRGKGDGGVPGNIVRTCERTFTLIKRAKFLKAPVVHETVVN